MKVIDVEVELVPVLGDIGAVLIVTVGDGGVAVDIGVAVMCDGRVRLKPQLEQDNPNMYDVNVRTRPRRRRGKRRREVQPGSVSESFS